MFEHIGRLLAAYRRPVCVIQEGGYELASLILCGEAFAAGLLDRDGEPSGIRREEPPWYERPQKVAEPPPPDEPSRAEQALAMWRTRKGWSRRGGRR